jgi:hypothetical protein
MAEKKTKITMQVQNGFKSLKAKDQDKTINDFSLTVKKPKKQMMPKNPYLLNCEKVNNSLRKEENLQFEDDIHNFVKRN